MEYQITIPGQPVAKARPRVTKAGHAYTPAKTKAYERLVQSIFIGEYGKPQLEGPLLLEMDLYFQIPKSTRKKDVPLMLDKSIRPVKRPDLDNVLKAVSDALNKIAYKDDSQIVGAVLRKYYGDDARTEVRVTSL